MERNEKKKVIRKKGVCFLFSFQMRDGKEGGEIKSNTHYYKKIKEEIGWIDSVGKVSQS